MSNTCHSAAGVDLGNYEVLSDFTLDFAPVTVTKYRSKKTGFQVVVGNHKAPITNASFIVATEVFDDSGLPHTLEHLIFLGSKSYPYKGVLDGLANRAGGDGVSAWTTDDHTAYTISTAGSEGVLNVIPIFLEHILYPTLTDTGFLTEVYHINGKGEEAGVVMSEMQGVERQSVRVLMQQLALEMYPAGSAYPSVTGGLLSGIRKLTVEEIRHFHAATYKPWNVCLHIDGSIPVHQLMRILNNRVDPMILANSSNKGNFYIPDNWKRPFLETPSAPGPVITQNVRKVIPYMDKDETVGEVMVGWQGAKTSDHLTETATKVLTAYLADSRVAPLNKRFIEIVDPACTSINFYMDKRASHGEITCYIQGVNNVKRVGESQQPQLYKMDTELNLAISEVAKAGVDMDRINTIIQRDQRNLVYKAESKMSDVLLYPIIADFLYGNQNGKDLQTEFDHLKRYDTLLSWKTEQWSELITRLFVNSPSVVIVGRPSSILTERIASEQAEFLEATKTRLGVDGLATKEIQLRKAQAENEQEIPEVMITSFPISDTGKIGWISVESGVNVIDTTPSKSGKVQEHLDQDGDMLPYFVHYSHVQSKFISIRALIDTTVLPPELKPYVKIYEASLFALDLQRSDSIMPYEEVVKQLTDLTVSYEAGLGIQREFPEVLQIVLKVEKERYPDAIAWLRDLLAKSIFSSERLAVSIAKLVQDLPERKRNGQAVAWETAKNLAFDAAKSTSNATSLHNDLIFLPKIAAEIRNQPDVTIAKLRKLREMLLNPGGMRLAVSGDILGIPNPRTAWARNFCQTPKVSLAPLPDARAHLSDLGQAPAKRVVLVSIPSIQSSFAVACGKGPYGWGSDEVLVCTLAAGVLNAYESYFWASKHIRGPGLAYHTTIQVDAEHGLLYFEVIRSPDAFKAFEAAGRVVRDLANGTTKLGEYIVDAAKSSMSYTLAKKEGNVDDAATTVLVNEVFKNIPADAGAKTLERIKDFTKEQVLQALIKYIVPLFDPDSSFVVVACATALTAKIQSQFRDVGYVTGITELATAGNRSGNGEGSTETDGNL